MAVAVIDEQPAKTLKEVEVKVLLPVTPILDPFMQVWKKQGFLLTIDMSILVANIAAILAKSL